MYDYFFMDLRLVFLRPPPTEFREHGHLQQLTTLLPEHMYLHRTLLIVLQQ